MSGLISMSGFRSGLRFVMMAAEAVVELFECHVAAFVGVETGKHGVGDLGSEVGECGDCAELCTSEESVVSGDFSEMCGAAIFDTLTDGRMCGFLFFTRDFSVAVCVDGVAAFLTTLIAKLFDSLALFSVDFSVLIRVKLLKEFRKGSVSDSLVTSLGGGDRANEGRYDCDLC